ncbi:MAG: sensor histidine kinase [Lacipirellulaceae bacterium]
MSLPSRRPPTLSPDKAAESLDEVAAAERERFGAALERAKLDAMKELAYGASHEVNNPLANIALRAQSLLKREADPDKRKMLEAIHRSAMRAHEMISDLMLFARPPKAEKRVVALAGVAREVIADLAALAADRSIGLALREAGPAAPVWADPTHVAVALRAVIDNALEAVGHGGAVAVVARQPERDPRFVTIEVRDDGPGVPPEVAAHVFDPFFSGREAGRGLGFGLSKCWRLVTDHGGTVTLKNLPGRGVVVAMRWPVAEGAP